jgi:hypothetical protein
MYSIKYRTMQYSPLRQWHVLVAEPRSLWKVAHIRRYARFRTAAVLEQVIFAVTSGTTETARTD